MATVIVVLVVAGFGLGSFRVGKSGQPNTVTPSDNANTLASPCSTPFSYNSANPLSVLVATPGSTGQICVEYSNDLDNTEALPTYHTVYQYNSSGVYGVCAACSLNVVTSIRVTPSQDIVSFSPSKNPSSEIAYVTYTVTVPSNATKGVYGIFLLQFCSLFPVLVVPNGGGQVTADKADFTPWYPHYGSCPAQVLGAQVLGVSGFRIATAE